VYVLQAKMGGVANLIGNLLAHRRADGMDYAAVFTDNRFDRDTRFFGPLPADRQATVAHELSFENAHAVFLRLLSAVGARPGVLATSDELELHACHVRDPGKTVVQILHGNYDYYFNLAKRHERVIDAFVAISKAIARRLKSELPHRAADVHYLPFGVPLPDRVRTPRTDGPLRLIYAGRMWHEQKGVFDLPLIDRELRTRGIAAAWTIVGDGPDFEAFRLRWSEPIRADFLGNRPHAEVLKLLPEHDVFVLPTRMEGFPVSLMEAMAAGLVPVASDIESGVPEIVDETTGFRPQVGDVAGFADAIEVLQRDRARLNALGAAARGRMEAGFDLRDRVADYQALFARFRELKRPRPYSMTPPYGSRLDRPWIPNWLVKAVRGAHRNAKNARKGESR
jgi:glycosyltransferase involved in cell wall biosynthesis